MLGNHSILGVQVDGIKGITQGIVKFSSVLVIIHRNGGLPFDPKSFTGRGFVHHSVNTGILTTGNRLEEFEHAENRFSAGQVGLSLRARIGGIGTEDMIHIPFGAADGLHRFATPGIPLFQSTFLNRLIVHLLNLFGVLTDHIFIQALVNHDLSTGLTVISTQTLKPKHTDHSGIPTAIDDLLTTQLIIYPLSSYFYQPTLGSLSDLFRILIISKRHPRIQAGFLGQKRIQLTIKIHMVRNM